MKTNARNLGIPDLLKISAAILTVLCSQPTEAQAGSRIGGSRMAANTAAIIEPFQNSADSVSIDELTVENGEDRIAVYGALNITRDKEGLWRAQKLKALLDETVKKLLSEKLPEHVAIKPAEKIGNPFR